MTIQNYNKRLNIAAFILSALLIFSAMIIISILFGSPEMICVEHMTIDGNAVCTILEFGGETYNMEI